MSNISKVNIPIAKNRVSKLDLSGEHQTTMSWLQCQPVFYRHMLKGENIDINALATIRPEPMAVPTFGRCRMNIRGFYVPFYLVFPQFSKFYQDTIGSDFNSSSLVADSPYFVNSDVVDYFKTTIIVLPDGTTEPLMTTDATYTADDSDVRIDTGTWYRFGTIGRRFIKVLECLGYEINWNTKDNTPISALGLLAMSKVYLDWYANPQYLDSAAVLRLEQMLAYQKPGTPLQISGADLGLLLRLITNVVYDNDDYFNNAWDNPQSPINTQTSLFNMPDVSVLNNQFLINATNTAHIQDFGVTNAVSDNGTVTSVASYENVGVVYPNRVGGTISVYQHQALQKLQNFIKRHQLSGARVIDRVLTDAGFASARDRLDRSIYVGGTSIDVNVGDVYSTANTAGANDPSTLGDYAGRGFGQGSKGWQFTSDDMGIFLVIASIIPESHIVIGMDRNNLHLSKMQFFQQSFDALGVQLLQKREVYVSRDGSFGGANDYSAGFGFTGQYGEYKRPKSWLTGDLRRRSVLRGGSAFTLARLFDDSDFSGDIANLVHSLDFTRAADWAQFNRIFNYTGVEKDPFTVDFQFKVGSYAPCAPLFETYDFEEDSKTIKIDTNGTRLN